MFFIIFNFYLLLANSVSFVNKNEIISFKELKTEQASYISLTDISNKFNFKINYNRVLHKLSFSYKEHIVLFSSLTTDLIINSDLISYNNSIKFLEGKFYINTNLFIEHFLKIFNLKHLNNIIVLDAGHGGSDEGAKVIYKNKTIYEKDIVLTFSKILKDKIIEKGFNVVLTREKDEALDLNKRIELANNSNAQVFISIHANLSTDNKEAKGFEVYYLSEKASDTHSHVVAIAENEVFKEQNIYKDEHVAGILKAMYLSSHIEESTKLAYNIYSETKKHTNTRGVKKAPFYVLAGTYMPSVLIELGFMSNTQDLENLLNDKWLNKLAESIAIAVSNFMQNNYRSNIK